MAVAPSRALRRIFPPLALFLALGIAFGHSATPVNDFTEYWSSARLLISHQNPYSPQALGRMEEDLGRTERKPLIMLNPPWIFSVTFPFALFSYRTGYVLWMWVNILAVLYCVRALWRLYAGEDRVPKSLWLVVGLFLPMYVLFAIGQISALVLLGIILFLCALRDGRYGLAGLALFLVALKPHLAFLLWATLFAWVIRERRWRVAYSFAGAMAVACAIPLIFDRTVMQQYAAVWSYGRVVWRATPTVGGALSLWLASGGWIAFLPFLAALAWVAVYWMRRRRSWEWLRETPLLFLVSVAASPYAWFFDQVLLVPAMVQVVAGARGAEVSKWMRGFLVYAGVNVAILIFFIFDRAYFGPGVLFGPGFAWVAPAWLLVYLGLRRKKKLMRLAAGPSALEH